jgi:nucleoside-triphosphatase THEP1
MNLRPGLPRAQIVILTGAPGTGKTTTCRQLVDRVRDLGHDCAGILCPSRVAGGVKVGIDVVDVRTEERRQLAEVDELPGALRMGPYRFDEEAIAWGVARLGIACPCDLLIVDEVGPLEMSGVGGWTNAVEILRTGDCRLAVAVVRPSLVDAVRAAVNASGRAQIRACVSMGPTVATEILTLAGWAPHGQ